MTALKWYEDPKVFRDKRKRLGLTQQKLAKKSGVDRTIIANIEAGRRKLTGDVADLLWRVLTNISALRRRELLSPEQRTAERMKLKLSKEEYEAYARKYIERLKKTLERLRQRDVMVLEGKKSLAERVHASPDFADNPLLQEIFASYQREVTELEQQIESLKAERNFGLTRNLGFKGTLREMSFGFEALQEYLAVRHQTEGKKESEKVKED